MLEDYMTGRLGGITIHATPFVPEFKNKRELSISVNVSDKFRREFNEWMADFFGRERVVIMLNGKAMVHPNTKRFIDHEFLRF